MTEHNEPAEHLDPAEPPQGDSPGTPHTPEIDSAELDARVEAVLMSVDRAISGAKLAEAVEAENAKAVSDAIDRLNAFYNEHARSFRIEPVAGGYQILTLPRFGDVVAALHKTRAEQKLSPAALETLAIIAYKQPVLRAEVESIRGVACGEVIRTLMDKHLVKITGRADEIGRPLLYGTTKTFLELFGLSGLKDLPKAEELAKP